MTEITDINHHRERRALDLCLNSVLDAYCDLLEGNTGEAMEQLADILMAFGVMKAEINQADMSTPAEILAFAKPAGKPGGNDPSDP